MPNRIVSYTIALLGLVGAIAPVAADLDWESTAGVLVGIGVIASIGVKWLEGWQRYEERTDLERLADSPEVPPQGQ